MSLRAENLSKRYFRRLKQRNNFFAVQNVSLTLNPGEVTVLMGRSGSGKTTLLNMLSGLLIPTEGRVLLDDQDIYALEDGPLSKLRNQKLGVIPQGRSAIDTLTVLENVLFPLAMYGTLTDETRDMALTCLQALDIEHLSQASPSELSGGEIRRMAIARALCQDADYLLADEPTGDLDDENTRRALELLHIAAHRDRKAVLIVSHDPAAKDYADHLYRMDSGRLNQ